jgi:hypothetical protein
MQLSAENIAFVQQELSGDFNLPVTTDQQQLVEALAASINHLIGADFARFINLLYRIDISENTLRETLKKHADQDAGVLIAGLVIERQLLKQKMRARFNSQQNIPDDEKW